MLNHDRNPAGSGARYELRGPKGERLNLLSSPQGLSIGRLPDNDLVVNDATVSRKHALVRYWEGRVEVRDNGSSKGSFIDGKPVSGGNWHRLSAGGVLKLGRYSLQLEKVNPELEGAGPVLAGLMPEGPTDAGLLLDPGPTLSGLHSYAQRPSLDSRGTFWVTLNRAIEALSNRRGIIRIAQGLPTLVIPDMHGQRDYLIRALSHTMGSMTVFERLCRGTINVLCLGDGMHGERRVRERWLDAEKEFLAGAACPSLEAEAVESLGLMKMVMDLIVAFPHFFHYLRGNHDEVNNPARKVFKYTSLGESELFRRYLGRRWGQDFVEKWAEFEESLPLLALGEDFVASHSAPGVTLSRPEIESRSDRAFVALAWTDNRNWSEDGPHREVFLANLKELGVAPEAHWLIGHCKVHGADYRAQLGGRLIQINPRDAGHYVVALIPAQGGLQPQRDIFRLEG